MDIKPRKLPIGIQSFESLRNDGYLYVDKTRFIYELAQNGKQYFLSRPRRFGKSLLLSTMCAYWEGKRELFEGLHIVELEKDNETAWQQYPVFYFDFNRDNFQRKDALEMILNAHLSEWERIYRLPETGQSLSIRFQNLLVQAYQMTGKRCVVLVDEYDKPLLEALRDKELEEHNKAVFKGFFSTLKSYDRYLQFVFITGVTKFSKISIFSDLNQLKDISLQSKYASICGITENELKEIFMPEIRRMSESQGMKDIECMEQLKHTYDGYHFYPESEGVFNPFSLLNALDEMDFRAFWFSTGTPTFLIQKIKDTRFDIRRFTDKTLYAQESDLSDYRADNPDPVPILYQTGYLTIVGYDARRRRYTLGFPNEEVKYAFLENLMPEYAPACMPGTGTDIFTLDEYIENGEPDNVKNVLKALFASIPYTTKEAPFEHYFQSVIYLVFTLLGRFVKCEVHSSSGRADCIVETERFVYIFEFKIDKTAEEALAQIEEKGYALPYTADQRKVLRIGVSFDSKSRSMADWKTI